MIVAEADPRAPGRSAAALDDAVAVLARGGLVILPTDRWYMLCCDAADADACARVYAAKRRPPAKSLLLVLPHPFPLDERFRTGPGARALAAGLWPGDLALLLPWADPADGAAHAAVGTPVALTCQPAGLLGALAARFPGLLAATSANVSGIPGTGGATAPAVTAAEARAFAAGAASAGTGVDLLLDGGICPAATHLTIVDCGYPDAVPGVTREGTVHRRSVAAALAGAGVGSGE